ncbi:MAG: hypothetical protein BWY19_01144 [bacterium ADurb.Bin212]|nr:MAG: hypothetical protein BWY19_01144 [bacterium ADurb.Bin212]
MKQPKGEEFWENEKKESQKKGFSFRRVLLAIGIVFIVFVIIAVIVGAISEASNKEDANKSELQSKPQKASCDYSEFNSDNLFKMINVMRVENNKSSLAKDNLLTEYVQTKIPSITKGDPNTGKDFFTWASGKNGSTFKSTYPIYFYDSLNICELRDYIKGNNQLFSYVTDSRFNLVGAATSGSTSFIMLGEAQGASSSSSSTQQDRAYAQSEIDRLTAGRDSLQSTLDKQKQERENCTSDMCREYNDKAINSLIDGIAKFNQEINEWRRSLVK